MNPTLQKILDATHLTKRGDLVAATAAIQAALGAVADRAPTAAPFAAPNGSERVLASSVSSDVVDVVADPVDARAADEATADRGGRFLAGRHAGLEGERAYKLFVPAAGFTRPTALVVMLHGCQQDPDDFAAGTKMNERAAAEGFHVLYPAQAPRSNAQRCWNWFQPTDQRRGGGEPALLAAMVRRIAGEWPIDADRVYVAGLSAGGAMAAILAREYADVFAAAGIHSGLPPGAAHDIASAFAAMQHGQGRPPAWPGVVAANGMRAPMAAWPQTKPARDDDAAPGAPLIVFHGDADTTVHPSNGSHVLDAGLGSADWESHRETAPATPGRRRSTRLVYMTPGTGAEMPSRAEHWVVHGGGHAWSGGSASGSFTDPDGPDATGEMLRFFAEHPRRPPTAPARRP